MADVKHGGSVAGRNASVVTGFIYTDSLVAGGGWTASFDVKHMFTVGP